MFHKYSIQYITKKKERDDIDFFYAFSYNYTKAPIMKNVTFILCLALISCWHSVNDVNSELVKYRRHQENLKELEKFIEDTRTSIPQTDRLAGWEEAYTQERKDALLLIDECEKLLDTLFLPTGKINNDAVNTLKKKTKSLEWKVNQIRRLYESLELLSPEQNPSARVEGFFF